MDVNSMCSYVCTFYYYLHICLHVYLILVVRYCAGVVVSNAFWIFPLSQIFNSLPGLSRHVTNSLIKTFWCINVQNIERYSMCTLSLTTLFNVTQIDETIIRTAVIMSSHGTVILHCFEVCHSQLKFTSSLTRND